MNKIIFAFFGVFCVFLLTAQTNRYNIPAKANFQSTYVPINYDLLFKLGKEVKKNDTYKRDIFDEGLIVLDKIYDGLLDCMASFMQFPEVHSNTIRVYEQMLEIKKALKDQRFNPAEYENPQLIWSNPKVQQYYKKVDEILFYADIFEELLGSFKGYNPAGLSQDQMSVLDIIFRKFGWRITLLDVNCRDTFFYEYQLKGCKMMFIKNNLPPADYNHSIYNNIEVDFTYDYYGTGGAWYIGGGKYRMIQFQDDDNLNYHKVIKATSERK